MEFRTTAPMYFVMGNPFPIELRTLEHSTGLVRLLVFFTFCPQELEIAGELEIVAHVHYRNQLICKTLDAKAYWEKCDGTRCDEVEDPAENTHLDELYKEQHQGIS